jgi:hypothetical protein
MYGVIQQGCVSKHQSGDITKNPQDDAWDAWDAW